MESSIRNLNATSSLDRIGNEEFEEQRRAQMFKLSQIIKTLDDFKAIKQQVTITAKQIMEIDQWRHLQSQQQTKELVLRNELNMLIDMIKRETEVAMRTHFEIFKNETNGDLQRKVEMKDLKGLLA